MELALLIGQILLRFGPKVAAAYQQAVKTGDAKDWEVVFSLAEQPWKDGVVGEDGLVH